MGLLARLMAGEGTGYAVFAAHLLALSDVANPGPRELKIADPPKATRARITFAVWWPKWCIRTGPFQAPCC
ncbi:hypothetical protein ACFFLM_06970 [Deinococcus oregonensis]|uniref:Uncharacterized protein n=1 Tax=Deinococcus oregonensis TaxID=1805970 RepID=A0ABV6AW18_9DEIO